MVNLLASVFLELVKMLRISRWLLFVLPILLFTSCSPVNATLLSQDAVTVFATFAAEPWLEELFVCANDLNIPVIVSAESPQITIRLGEPEWLVSSAYQIGEEELLVATHQDGLLQQLSLPEVQEVFSGQANPEVQAWGYAPHTDMQVLFDQLVMKERGAAAFAGMVVSPQQLVDLMNAHPNRVGLLPSHWVSGNIREIYSVGTVPVLALTDGEPQGAVGELIACLQK